MTESHTLLASYVRTGSESAFKELVSRYLDLVYSTAFRLVGGDAQSTQDVVQTVFVALADKAGTLPKDVMLGGWLHEHTRFVAGKLMRAERRRHLRERQVAEMNAIEDHSESNLAQVAPVLDEAIGQLDAEDRTAILLRFFERKDFRSVGEALGSSEEAARKRVDRALEKLQVLLKHRGATLSAAALGTALATEAVTAAPVGLAATISSAAIQAGRTVTTSVTTTKAIAMTTLQKALVAATVAVLAGAGVYQARQASRLREEALTLQQQRAPLSEEIQLLLKERDEATNRVATLHEENERLSRNTYELLRLRAELTRLRNQGAQEGAADSPSSAAEDRSRVISLRVVKPDELRSQRVGTTFLVTNHTSSTIIANLSAIEVKAGTNWIAQMRPVAMPLRLSAPGLAPIPGSTNRSFAPGITVQELEPHGVAYTTLWFSGDPNVSSPPPKTVVGYGMNCLPGQPTGAIWRVNLSVQQKLTGAANASVITTRYAEMQRRFALAGVTDAPLDPSAYSFFGPPTHVVSEEVSQ